MRLLLALVHLDGILMFPLNPTNIKQDIHTLRFVAVPSEQH